MPRVGLPRERLRRGDRRRRRGRLRDRAASCRSPRARSCCSRRRTTSCEGASKGNTGIATSGADCAAGTLECDLVTRSSPRLGASCAPRWTRRSSGSARWPSRSPSDQEARLPELLAEAHAAGARAEIVERRRGARAGAAAHPAGARGALHFPDDGIVDSIRLTIGYAELAARNGVDVRRSSPVIGVRSDGGRSVARAHARRPDRGPLRRQRRRRRGRRDRPRWPAATSSPTWPRQGQYWLLDREIGGRFAQGGRRRADAAHPRHLRRAHHQPLAAARPDRRGPRGPGRPGRRRRHARPRVRRRAARWCRRCAASTRSRRSPPTGRRPTPSTASAATRSVANLVHAAGIRSTGVSSSPAVAELVRDLVAEIVPAAGDERAGRAARRWSRCRGCWTSPRPRSWSRPRPPLRPGDLRVRAGDRGRDRRRLRRGACRRARWRGCASGRGRWAAAARARCAWPAARSCTRCTPAPRPVGSRSSEPEATLGV